MGTLQPRPVAEPAPEPSEPLGRFSTPRQTTDARPASSSSTERTAVRMGHQLSVDTKEDEAHFKGPNVLVDDGSRSAPTYKIEVADPVKVSEVSGLNLRGILNAIVEVCKVVVASVALPRELTPVPLLPSTSASHHHRRASFRE